MNTPEGNLQDLALQSKEESQKYGDEAAKIPKGVNKVLEILFIVNCEHIFSFVNEFGILQIF